MPQTYSERFRLDGESALVMGAGGGRLGSETAVALAEAGASVIGVDIAQDEMADAAERVAALGGSFSALTVDVTDSEATAALIDRAWREHGPIVHYVHVVGGSRPRDWQTLERYDDEHFDTVFAFNLRPVFQCCREIARRMIGSRTQGTIVTFSSLSGLTSAPYHGPYGAAKAAVSALTRTLAVELGGHGIRVNSVAPGQTQVGSTRKRPPRQIHQDPRWNPLERGIEFSEVASAVLFLSSRLSSGITGQTLNVDAGASARSPMGGLEYWEQFGGTVEPPREDGAGD